MLNRFALAWAPRVLAPRARLLRPFSKGPVHHGDDEDDEDEDDEDDYDEDDGIDFDDLDLDEMDFDDDDDPMLQEPGSIGNKNVKEQVKAKVSIRRSKHSKRKFIDRIRLRVKGGHGGNGCTSFVSEGAGMKRPNGGHGGGGGDVILRVDARLQNLYKPTHHFNGGDGWNGMANDRAGRRGKDVIVPVPPGTIVKTVERIERWNDDLDDYEIVDRKETLVDLDTPGTNYTVAVGGKPGLGSRILTGKTTQYGGLRKTMPEGKVLGKPGTSQYLELELKTIADIGLVGYPNAGKSTLLRSLSRATPEVAPYPFTTLHPFVGIVEFPDTFRFSVADLPGLIEGAHKNVGLGHDFLRHIERTKILLYVLDTAGTEGRDPLSDLHHLQNELELYAPNITSRPSLIVANKMDAPGAGEQLERLRKATDLGVVPLSALHKVDIKTLASSLRWMIENYKKLN
ncbi:obg family GTPase CgtA [Saprolegnia parasitica CBS 223.65]|uniref:Obg family GTPase CgtA n=1 Tax=Saprolegnia parasitica (strain CBS 223.65) TaxID=695850 RepID=A0A067CHT0_SAPPC|nr:obg family GTPase CgtA [Saprolegnia parasitica CBS 223.65]KDO26106.1 obg family GTPase CgtA [Saprolegnia parasitica CBS 223.65]|eukprot:XP_012203102.1 obg family GTPase CgtA [Saprolegnia parasitica CBS 223.65]